MDSGTRFDILRKSILARSAADACDAWWFPLASAARRASEEHRTLPWELRVAQMEHARLTALRFTLAPEELLIGRLLPQSEGSPEEHAECEEYFRMHPEGTAPGQSGHSAPDTDDLFAVGIEGLRQKVDRLCHGTFAETCRIALDGFSQMIRHAAQAAREAGNTDIAERCERLTAQPPETFRDALQLLWFLILAIETGDRASLIVPGRLDRKLIGFYLNDLADGRITRDEARELIAQFYLFFNDLHNSGLAYAVMVGGDTVNELSYLALEALRLSRLSYPSVGVCVNRTTPDSLKSLALEIIAEGLPNPAFFNDTLIRQALRKRNVPASEAGNYINSTCVEITPCGASNVYVASPYFNLCGILLETMRGSHAGSFAEFRQEFFAVLDRKIAEAVQVQNDFRETRRRQMRRPLQSIFTRDCLARDRDIEDGGALYNWVECSFVGLANLVDSLYVIEQEVFETHSLVMADLVKLCETDFAGHEPLLRKFLNRYPKYGTADPRADGAIRPIIAHITAECAKYRMKPDDSPFLPGTFCWVMHQRLGAETCATPDGRRSGFPFADGAGPAQGREKAGPTAAVQSVCAWDQSGMLGGCAFNMKFPKPLLATPEARQKLLALIDVFLQNGGFETQINVADNETLKKAQLHPEEYADLVVRIGGYTDYFVKLSPGMQQEVLLRTEYDACR